MVVLAYWPVACDRARSEKLTDTLEQGQRRLSD